MSVASLEHVSKRIVIAPWRPQKTLLRDVAFSVNAGEVVGFVGHNGAGKSTTLRILTGLVRPSSGTAQIFGHSPLDARHRRGLGFAPEQPRLPEALTPSHVMALHATVTGAGNAAAVLERVGLTAVSTSPIATFSKGMKQRLSLAIALLGQPELLVLDEPMSGLDPAGRALVRHLILEEKARGVAVLFSTHVLPDVVSICDRVVVLRRGSVVMDRPLVRDTTTTGWRIETMQPTTLFANLARRTPTTLDVTADVDAFAVARTLEEEGVRVVRVTRADFDLESDILPLLEPDS